MTSTNYAKNQVQNWCYLTKYQLSLKMVAVRFLLQASRGALLIFWQVGKCINNEILDERRAEYGRSFEIRNLRRMMQFTEQFSDFEIVSLPATQLSWSHFVEILPLKTQEAAVLHNSVRCSHSIFSDYFI